MNTFLKLFIVFSLQFKITYGQQKERAVEIQKQSFYLTTTSSRAYIPVNIPNNTIKWFIAFTSEADNTPSPINLLAQISTKLFDRTGISSEIANSLTTPNGSANCDIMLADIENRRIFMSGSDGYSFYDNVSRSNLTNGVITVDDKYKGDYQILIYNPSYTTSANVSVEITAIVDDSKINFSSWTDEAKQSIFENCINNLKKIHLPEKTKTDISNCIIDKICNNYTQASILAMNNSEVSIIVNNVTDSCLTLLQGGYKTETQKKGETYGELGWKSYENGDIDKAIALSEKALTFDKSLGWVNANLGLFHLAKNNEEKALEYYVEAIQYIKKEKLTAKTTLEELIDDLKKLEKNYPEYKSIKVMMKQLKDELDNL